MFGLDYVLICESWHCLAGLLCGVPFLILTIWLTGWGARHIWRSRSFLLFSLLGLACISAWSHYVADMLAWGF
jgi:hypothetical protein